MGEASHNSLFELNPRSQIWADSVREEAKNLQEKNVKKI